MARVVLEQLSKVYPGGVTAVQGVDLDIAHGELIVLVGPSGCGKSTTLRMVAGLEEISGGALTIGDRVVNEVAGRDRNVAMVFQNYALYPHLSVEKNLAFGLDRRRTHKSYLRRLISSDYRHAARAEDDQITARVAKAAETLGITDLMNRRPGALSGGQRQRVAVGRALVRDPDVFLFDEPLSNLDAKLRVEMRAELRSLHEVTGATMLYVTHDQEEAMTLGDRLVVMKDGIVQQIATPREVYDRPENQFVAGFIGTPSMNFLTMNTSASSASDIESMPAAVRELESAVLGIRPDRLSLDPVPEAVHFPCTVARVEDMGDRCDVHLNLAGGETWVARLAHSQVPDSVRELCVYGRLQDAHWFEGSGGGRRVT